MLAHSLFFYFFSTITVFSSIMVVLSRNTVYSVFFLILVFITTSILFIMIGAEFLGMIMLIVYVGAVAVLFLFVVMMLNVSEKKTENSKKRNIKGVISVGSLVGLIIFLELLVVVGGWKYRDTFSETKFVIITHHALTMSKMNRLYGVTMPEKGISQLVSVDLEKAEELVA